MRQRRPGPPSSSMLDPSSFLTVWVLLPCSAVAVGAVGVDGGGVLLPVLSNQLVKTVTEVLDLTGAQDTGHPHHVVPTAAAVGVATTPRPALPGPPVLGHAVTVAERRVR